MPGLGTNAGKARPGAENQHASQFFRRLPAQGRARPRRPRCVAAALQPERALAEPIGDDPDTQLGIGQRRSGANPQVCPLGELDQTAEVPVALHAGGSGKEVGDRQLVYGFRPGRLAGAGEPEGSDRVERGVGPAAHDRGSIPDAPSRLGVVSGARYSSTAFTTSSTEARGADRAESSGLEGAWGRLNHPGVRSEG